MSRFLQIALITLFCTAAALAQPPALSSLSSAGASTSEQGNYRVRLARGLTRPLAETLKADLEREGYQQVEVVESNGSFSVLVGANQGENQARALLKDLRAAGFTPEQVVSGSGADSSGTALPGGLPTTGEKVYRVLVSELPSSAEAEAAKEALRKEAFTDVDVVAEGDRYKVLLGTFKQREQAEKLLNDVRTAGFSLAQVTEAEQRAISSSGTEVASLPGAANLNATDRQNLQRISEMIEKQRTGETTADDVKQLQELIRQQNDQIQQLLRQQATARDQSADVTNQVWQLYREFDSLLLSRRFDQAAQVLERVRAIAPTEVSLPSKLKRLEQLRNGGGTAVAGGQPGAQTADPERVQTAIAEARKAEASGDLNAAQQKYMDVLTMDPQNTEARAKIAEIASLQNSNETTDSGNRNLIMYGGGAAVVLILILLAYWQFVNARREKRLEEQVAQLTRGGGQVGAMAPVGGVAASDTFVDPLAPGGMYSGGGSMGASPSATAAAGGAGLAGGLAASGFEMPNMGNFNLLDEEEEDRESEKQAPVAPTPAASTSESTESQGESDMVSISGMGYDLPAAAPAAPADPLANVASNAAETSESTDSINLDNMNLDFPPPPGDEIATGENSPVPTPSGGLPDFNLDELLKGTFPGAGKEIEPVESVGPSARIQDITPVSLPGLGDIPIPPDQKAGEEDIRIQEVGSAGIAAALGGLGTAPTVQLPAVPPGGSIGGTDETSSTEASGVHFEQTFEDEPVGSQPSDWKGDYDYASLTVDDQAGANGRGHCLKFEKRSGAGSASYHCRFPNAAGLVTVEFDIRCDDKNKYLLGFYVEKDEDFKQSVHTIVHRIDSRSQPSLRIQGEPVPYDLGSWRHVRYELNLLMGVVNAYVDDQHVVKDAKLPTIPAYVNTLSIRDNLATTGLLYLDNIRITRK